VVKELSTFPEDLRERERERERDDPINPVIFMLLFLARIWISNYN
jgi:hypothetical protein